jgi:hypothetical protein
VELGTVGFCEGDELRGGGFVGWSGVYCARGEDGCE